MKLKPCPFCGGEAKFAFARPRFMLKKYRDRFVFAGCPSCGATTKLFFANNRTKSPLLNVAHENDARKTAAEAWNRRAEENRF